MTRPGAVAAAGLLALAAAMGVGRFAFTPILPMMIEDRGLTLAQGGWLASANYAGYLAGALFAMRSSMASRTAINAGLLAIGISTALAAWMDGIVALLLLRFVPGFASALVLVHVSAWSLEVFAAHGRERLGGVVFAGVGVGIVFSGVVCLALAHAHATSSTAWAALGVCALMAAAYVWPVVREGGEHASTTPDAAANGGVVLRFWRLIYAHGAFGLGYIIPATFLPVMAKQVIADPAVFGWAWPVFGAAAAVSTIVSAPLAARYGARRVWAWALFLMAVGVVVPVVVPGLAGIVASALAVGGTFMVVTMLGVQEARREAGNAGRVLIAAMISAFAIGQVVGPLLTGALVHVHGGFEIALAIAAAPLVLAAFLLARAHVAESV